MDDISIQNQIKADEGFKLYVYPDSKGIPTVGWGHAFLLHSEITEEIAVLLFEMDWKRITTWYEFFIKKHQLSLNPTLNPIRRGVIINMLFQMGFKGVCEFKKMIGYLKVEDYEGAADEMLDSQWARKHKNRAFRLAQMMRTGEP